MAEVWLDEYKGIVYKRFPEIGRTETGDTSEAKALRKHLQCQSFEWYAQNVIPELYISTLKSKAGNGLKNDRIMCLGTAN